MEENRSVYFFGTKHCDIFVGVQIDQILKGPALKFKSGVSSGVASNLQLSREGINFLVKVSHVERLLLLLNSFNTNNGEIGPRSRSYQPEAFWPSGPGEVFFLG